MVAVMRAFLGHFFLVLIVPIVGLRPGKQMTPFRVRPHLFYSGLALTAIVGDEASVDELIPGKVRGTVDLVVNGTFWFGATPGLARGDVPAS
jgi:hypothetical protein